ncbi:MAG TPA: cytochrome c peroxidase [Steroidobacteraceae bacterium]|jgi:cytochrome c peroxidase
MSRDRKTLSLSLVLALAVASASVLALTVDSGRAAEGAAAASTAAPCPPHLAFLKSACGKWRASVLPEHLPPSRNNSVADSEVAASLGMRIFYDNRFSKAGSGIACVSCHDPEHTFAEKKARSNTLKEVSRNAPDLIDAAWYSRTHFWDGKVADLWAAPLFTFEQPDEMGSTRLRVAHQATTIYKIRYEKAFGSAPDLSDTKRFPADGKPGMPEFDSMSMSDKALVNGVYANVGKALEAYIRKLAAGRSRFDDFINGTAKALTSDAQRGMVAFTRHGCGTCHSGPTFSDERFHDLGIPPAPGQPQEAARAFRTPTLRNVALTNPYGHNGAFDTLEGAIDAHARVLSKQPALDSQEKHDIVEFLRALSGRPPQPPWNYWPGG